MIPAFIACSYEITWERRRTAAVTSFHALGWMAGILATGVVGDIRLAFLVSPAFFVGGLLLTLRLPEVGVRLGSGARVRPGDSVARQIPLLGGPAEAHRGHLRVDDPARGHGRESGGPAPPHIGSVRGQHRHGVRPDRPDGLPHTHLRHMHTSSGSAWPAQSRRFWGLRHHKMVGGHAFHGPGGGSWASMLVGGNF